MDKLVPFRPHAGAFSLAGFFSFAKGRLHLKFELRDPRREVVGGLESGVHGAADVVRADDLWRGTCFEAFWGEPGKPGYWELNLAPDGKRWNLYRFDGYRVPQPPARSDDFSLERITVRDGTLDCVLLARASAPPAAVEASVCAVLMTKEGPVYYSLSHAGAKADFHLRSSFCIQSG